MAKKEKVDIVRSEEFESVDQELADAMALLDQVNARVIDLLQGERPPAPAAAGVLADEPASAAEEEIAGPAVLEDTP